ncbi:36486_t:CDS:1, partial [Racocetra persica]
MPLNEQEAVILGIEPLKHKTYRAIIKRYEALAKENEWTNEDKSVWPISRENLTRFITHLHLKVAPQTITSYLSALKHHHTMNHLKWDEIRYDPLIKQLLKTIENNHIFKPTRQKEHITRDQLWLIKTKLNPGEPDDILFWSVALVAFYGLARLGELLPKSNQDMGK